LQLPLKAVPAEAASITHDSPIAAKRRGEPNPPKARRAVFVQAGNRRRPSNFAAGRTAAIPILKTTHYQ